MEGRYATEVKVDEIIGTSKKLSETGNIRIVALQLEMEMCELRKLILGQPIGRVVYHQCLKRNQLAGEEQLRMTRMVLVYDRVWISDGEAV